MTASLFLFRDWLALGSIVTSCVSCSTDEGATPSQPDGGNEGPLCVRSSEPLCDGISELRLRVFQAPPLARERRGSVVRIENGYPSFAIDGNCSYWMGGGWFSQPGEPRDLDWRVGQLDEALQNAIQETIPLGCVPQLNDCAAWTTVFDASARIIADKHSALACVEGGPRFDSAWNLIVQRAVDLWQSATPIAEGVHISAIRVDEGDDSKTYMWPLSAPLAAFQLSDGLEYAVGASTLVTDVVEADALRALRREYLRDRAATPGLFFEGQKMSDGATTLLVYFRDALPYEDERGIWPFWPPGLADP